MAKMPIEVHDGIFVGSGADTYKFAGSMLHCAKNPWFDEAIANLRLLENIGSPRQPHNISRLPRLLNGNAILIDYNEMALNMVDANDHMYFGNDMVDAGLQFITDRLAEGDPVLVHCQMGISRSPSMAFLWMFEHGFLDDDFQQARFQFTEIYPFWMPGQGVRKYLEKRCQPIKETTSDPSKLLRGWFTDESFGDEK